MIAPDGSLIPEPDTMPKADALENCCPDTVEKKSPCWDGYVQRGMKPGKDGKPVPNCVPVTQKTESFFNFRDTKPTRNVVRLGE